MKVFSFIIPAFNLKPKCVMLFPNKISQCLLLLFAGMIASVFPFFIVGSDVPFYYSTIILFLITFGIPLLLNRIRRHFINIDYSCNYIKIIRENKTVHLCIISYLILSVIVKDIFITAGNECNVFNLNVFLGAVVYGPIIEELIFRYTILSGLLERYSMKYSILLSSSLFALMHYNVIDTMNENAYSILNAFILSVFIGSIFVRSRNIVYVILLHSLINIVFSFS